MMNLYTPATRVVGAPLYASIPYGCNSYQERGVHYFANALPSLDATTHPEYHHPKQSLKSSFTFDNGILLIFIPFF